MSLHGTCCFPPCCVSCRGADPFFADDLGEPRNDQGWEVVAVNTSPLVGAVGNAKIHFGRLLGAGSFGRVYKGMQEGGLWLGGGGVCQHHQPLSWRCGQRRDTLQTAAGCWLFWQGV